MYVTTKIGINGFGRIGRMVFRRAVAVPELEIAAINASYEAATLAHMLRYDSTHGRFEGDVRTEGQALVVNGHKVPIFSDRDPQKIPWGTVGTEIVVDATGKFKDRTSAGKHLRDSVKKVVITAPSKDIDITIVMGVNEKMYDPRQHHLISNASCTTNCLAPVVKVLHDTFGINYGLMTTVHSYTNDQRNLDNMHKDLRRARTCAASIIPTTTGAAKTIGQVIPSLQGKLNGVALRVPTPNVSIVDLVAELQQPVTKESVNKAFQDAIAGDMAPYMAYTEEPLVSIDFNHDPHSAIIDASLTMVLDKNKVKIMAWYDNEWAYSCRVVDLVQYIASRK